MARKSDGPAGKAAAPVPVKIFIDEPESDKLRAIGGSQSDKFNNALISAVVKTGWFPPGQSDEDRNLQLFVSVTAMRGLGPTDEVEGLLVAQAMAAHHASIECSRLAMIAAQPFELAQGFRKAAANASRTFIELLSALDRRRGKGSQHVRVEHVHVHSGGKAIVGNIEHSGRGGGGAEEMREEPHAPDQLAHTPVVGPVLPPLWSPDPERESVPRSSNGEREMQNARRKQYGTADGRGGGAHPGGPDDARDAHDRDGASAQDDSGSEGGCQALGGTNVTAQDICQVTTYREALISAPGAITARACRGAGPVRLSGTSSGSAPGDHQVALAVDRRLVVSTR